MINRMAFCLFLGVAIVGNALDAQVVAEREESNQVYKLSVTPAKLPVPAFKYRFTVEPHEQIPGNAVTHYLRSQGENSLRGPDKAAYEKFGDKYYEWMSLDVPLKDLPLEQVKEATGLFDPYIKNHIVRATKCRDIEWGLNEEGLSGMEAIEFLLPSVQGTRRVSRALGLKTRLLLVERKYAEAVDHIRMNYRIAECVSKMNFLVCSLIGIAEIGITNQNVIDFIAAEDSPNLYWALRELPTPIVSVRDAVRLEMSLAERMIPELKDPLHASHTVEEWAKIYRESVGKALELSKYTMQNPPVNPNSKALNSLMAIGASAVAYPSAKQRLIESGLNAERVNQMPVGQVLMVDAANDYRYFSDQVEASFYLGKDSDRFGAKFGEEARKRALSGRLGAVIADLALPAVTQVNRANLRSRREIAVLITIESIRNHLAVHGEMPDSLDDLDLPPVVNPFTGKNFEYEKTGNGTAVLNLPRSDGHPLSYRFEIKVRSSN